MIGKNIKKVEITEHTLSFISPQTTLNSKKIPSSPLTTPKTLSLNSNFLFRVPHTRAVEGYGLKTSLESGLPSLVILLSDVNVGFYASDHSIHTILLDGNGYRSSWACPFAPPAASAAILALPVNHGYVVDDLHSTVYAHLEA